MKIVFRTDSSMDIGTGHVMRCLTLADELMERGADVSFVCRKALGNLIQHIEDKGYRVYPLPPDIDLSVDRDLTQKILQKQTELIDWLIIDHYEIDILWESYLRKYVKKIMVIDDLANRYHDCDILLDQNISVKGNRYNGFVPLHCLKLLGPEYALLMQEFAQARMSLKERAGEVKRILVTMGGVDHENQTAKVLKGIKMLGRNDISVDVILGASNPNRSKIEEMISEMQNAKCFNNVKNMADFMVKADIAIGASGSTTWERCCLGLPSIVMVLADNQKDIAEELEKEGVVVNLGWHEDVTEMDIKNAVENLLADSDKRGKMNLKGKEMVDGIGIKKVVEKIIEVDLAKAAS